VGSSGDARTIGAAALLAVALGCTQGPDCDAAAVFGVSVTVRDGHTMALVCDAVVTVTDGTFVERLQGGHQPPPFPACGYFDVPERPGTYQVLAVRNGYLPAVVDDVTVTQGQCHVNPQSVTVTLASR
jgi:hypothetical protein